MQFVTKRRIGIETCSLSTRQRSSHTAATTMDAIQCLKLDNLPHPSYSSDLAVCNFHVFRTLQEALHDRWFGGDEHVKVVHTYLRVHPKIHSSPME